MTGFLHNYERILQAELGFSGTESSLFHMSCSLVHTPVITSLHILLLLAVCLPCLPPSSPPPTPEINSWLAPKRGSLPRLLKDLGNRADETAELEVLSWLPGKNRTEGVWLCRRREHERVAWIAGACVGLHADPGETLLHLILQRFLISWLKPY